MTRDGFEFVANLVKGRSGLVLTSDKLYMLEARLTPILKREGLPNLDGLAAKLRSPGAESILRDVVEALTTNESSFFRDGKPFDHLRRYLPILAAARPPSAPIRIWSAACSAGQEAYSIGIVAEEERAKLGGHRVEVYGCDISREMVDRAREGLYTSFEVQRGLPSSLLVKHFEAEGAKWRVNRSLKTGTKFEVRNLLEDCKSLGRFDVIFCRNVLIYFDAPTKTKVLASLAEMLAPDGILYLGGAETVLGLTDRFVAMKGERGVYVHAPKDGAGLLSPQRR